MKNRKKILIFITLIVVFLLTYSLTYAKYIYNKAWEYYLSSNGFYFSSDHLSSNGVSNTNSLWQGEPVYFNIKNNKNSLVITEYNINYEVSCEVVGSASSYTDCLMNGGVTNTMTGVLSANQACENTTGDGVPVSSLAKKTCELGGYTWKQQIALQNLYFEVILTDSQQELSEVTVNVTMKSISPYKTTLIGIFNLKKGYLNEDEIIKSYQDLDYSGRLTLTNGFAETKCLEVNWDADLLLLDADFESFVSYETDNNDNVNALVISMAEHASLNLLFYKRDFGASYTITEFIIIDSVNCTS